MMFLTNKCICIKKALTLMHVQNASVFSANVKLNQEHRHSTMTTSIRCACFQFNAVSCVFVECLDEPWHVGVCAAGSLQTTTLLSIPQDIREHKIRSTGNITPRFTVVVIANVGRNLVCASCVTWTSGRIDRILVIPNCVCPYMVTRIAMKYRQSIKVHLVYVRTIASRVWLKCIRSSFLISSHSSTHLLVADGSI